MKIWQLYEGQDQQIARLRPNAVVDLYHPSSVKDAIALVGGKYQDTDPLLVTSSLKKAMALSNVALHFWTNGKSLEAPRRLRKNAQDRQLAAEKYPESSDPLVSFSLLSQTPVALLKRYPMPDSIESVYVMVDGDVQKMSPLHFVEWFIKLVRRSKEPQETIESRLNERYNRSVRNHLIGA